MWTRGLIAGKNRIKGVKHRAKEQKSEYGRKWQKSDGSTGTRANSPTFAQDASGCVRSIGGIISYPEPMDGG